jgi:hypothetical protein
VRDAEENSDETHRIGFGRTATPEQPTPASHIFPVKVLDGNGGSQMTETTAHGWFVQTWRKVFSLLCLGGRHNLDSSECHDG